ncbi:hypothetical protein RRG08_017938 [Elysia crispata]|uniref:Uncharacterized protein n=1 Tax=Elysia crispata TaxID=231223 RepID=A0AAE0Y468_9GAST|nr:hypothetical protein RRG08_017938 [Elysia crispata]
MIVFGLMAMNWIEILEVKIRSPSKNRVTSTLRLVTCAMFWLSQGRGFPATEQGFIKVLRRYRDKLCSGIFWACSGDLLIRTEGAVDRKEGLKKSSYGSEDASRGMCSPEPEVFKDTSFIVVSHLCPALTSGFVPLFLILFFYFSGCVPLFLIFVLLLPSGFVPLFLIFVLLLSSGFVPLFLIFVLLLPSGFVPLFLIFVLLLPSGFVPLFLILVLLLPSGFVPLFLILFLLSGFVPLFLILALISSHFI